MFTTLKINGVELYCNYKQTNTLLFNWNNW